MHTSWLIPATDGWNAFKQFHYAFWIVAILTILPEGADSIALSNLSLQSVADLQNHARPSADVAFATVTGYWRGSRLGGGIFKWVDGTCTPDHVVWFTADSVPSSSGCWQRQAVGNVLTPYDAGAIGDGISNDTGALNDLARAAGAKYKIYIPAGVFALSGIVLTTARQIWALERSATLVLEPGSTNNLVTLAASGLEIHGGTLDGNGLTIPTAGSCIYGSGDYSGVVIKDVKLQNCAKDGISLYNFQSPVLGNLTFGLVGVGTAKAGAFIRVYAVSPRSANLPGPVIFKIAGDASSLPSSYIINGIDIRSQVPGVYVARSKVFDVNMRLPLGNHAAYGVDIGLFYATDTVVNNVDLVGGDEAIGLFGSRNTSMSNITSRASSSFSLEVNESSRGSFINMNFSDAPVILDGRAGDAQTSTDNRLVNFSLNMNGAHLSPYSGAFQVQIADGLRIDGCRIGGLASGTELSVFYLENTHNVHISNCVFDGSGVAANAVNAFNVNGLWISHSTLKNTTSYGVRLFASAAATAPLDNITLSNLTLNAVGVPISKVILQPGAASGRRIRTLHCIGCSSAPGIETFDWLDVYHQICSASGGLDPNGLLDCAIGSTFRRHGPDGMTTAYEKRYRSKFGWVPTGPR